MRKICMIILFLLPLSSMADWNLRQTDDGHWINTSLPEGHELIIAHNEAQQTHFLLVLAIDRLVPEAPSIVSLTVDRGPSTRVALTLLERRHNSRLFRVELSDHQKKQYIERMIAGLQLRIRFGETDDVPETIQFSLLGFTAAFNDLLIADRVGRLDPDWLIEHGRDKELGCLYSANLYVQAMVLRAGKYSADYARTNLPRTGYRAVDNTIPDIVSQVYAVPSTQLPIEPRGEKYAIFKACMGE